jgi:2,3-bisphosphoglycerate-independent phosphoglycerate mutase
VTDGQATTHRPTDDARGSSPPTGRRPRPIVLVVLDGFGIGRDPASDAIAQADLPRWRALLAEWPHAQLAASEEAVGLPPGQMGNSEVGHLNLGAGRPVLPELQRIDSALRDGSFDDQPALVEAMALAARPGRRLHLISLVGPGGVHANDRHLVAIADLARRGGVRDVRIHAILDGRDTPPSSADGFVPDLERRLAAVHPDARIATVAGRFFAMDRDHRWERTEAAYDAIVHGVGEHASSAVAAIAAAGERGETDEFVVPTVIDGVAGTVRDGDVIVHANYRADRARQLTHALADADFASFDRAAHGPVPRDLFVVTLTAYEAGLPVHVAFPPEIAHALAEELAGHGWRQFHVAETEKYAHVTYFFNGGREAPWPGEDRQLVPSPKVATYDEAPAMSAAAVTDALVAAIESGAYDFIVANYANADMVGHTGNWDATIQAVEMLDACIARIADAMAAVEAADPAGAGTALLITADHGNADELRDASGAPVTAHSLNPVPIVLVGRAAGGRRLRNGVLADVAPTILELAGLPPWPGVTGRSLLEPR